MWVLIGLGNPKPEHVGTRHNVGRDFLAALAPKLTKKAKIIVPTVFMNESGKAVKPAVKSKAAAKQLVVVHDDLDLPLGRIKVSFGSSAGGHNGVKSVINALKTQDFTRVRIGISPSTPSGKLKRPDAEKIIDFVLGKFKPADAQKLKKAKKLTQEALELLLEGGTDRAMNEINSR